MVDAAQAREVIARSIERHGGERWSRIERLTVRPRALSGLVPWSKGNGRTFRLPAYAEIEPQIARATFFDYPRAGERGVFDAGRVALGDAPLAEHRGTFRGLAKLRRWRPLDALYFFGYALTHYHAMPWTLRDAEPLALRRTGRGNGRRAGNNEGGFALTVRFPPTLHTHSPVQTVYFAPDGLIVRHDYVADIVGSLARGAHFWRDYVTVEGIPIPTHRIVYARLFRQPLPLVALDAHFEPPSVTLAPGLAI
jgi:hypothetical protein